MPVDQKVLEACIKQAAEGDQELYDLMKKKYTENDGLAVKFVNGFTSNADYTRGKQELSRQSEKKRVQAQLTQYESRLQAAGKSRRKIFSRGLQNP